MARVVKNDKEAGVQAVYEVVETLSSEERIKLSAMSRLEALDAWIKYKKTPEGVDAKELLDIGATLLKKAGA